MSRKVGVSGLLKSKINDIEVLQIGDSLLSQKTNKQDSNKPKLTLKKKSESTVKTVSLGKGKQTYEMSFIIPKGTSGFSDQLGKTTDNQKLLVKQLIDEDYCTITDKFKGKFKAHIDKFDIKDSDRHLGLTTFYLECTIQDKFIPQSLNNVSKLGFSLSGLFAHIGSLISGLKIPFLDTITDAFNAVTSFIDTVANAINDGINAIVSLENMALDAYNSVNNTVNQFKRSIEAIKNITKFPKQFLDLCKNLIHSGTKSSGNAKIFNTTTPIKGVKKSTRDYGKEAEQEGVIIIDDTNIDDPNISGTAREELKRTIQANKLLNSIAVSKEINELLNVDFDSKEDFDKFVATTITRLEHTGLPIEEVNDIKNSLKGYANEQSYASTKTIYLKNYSNLTAVVYGIYGNLDKYEAIKKLNNFKDNDYIIGNVRVFDEDNN